MQLAFQMDKEARAIPGSHPSGARAVSLQSVRRHPSTNAPGVVVEVS
jgi:hypothetical protein